MNNNLEKIVLDSSPWLSKTLANFSSENFGKFPISKNEAEDLLKSFDPLNFFHLCVISDILSTIRQALAADNKVSSKENKLVAPVLRIIFANVAEIRNSYQQFSNMQDSKSWEALTYWAKDSEPFGGECKITRRLGFELASQFAVANEIPELYTNYQKMLVGIYKEILESDGISKEEKVKLDSFGQTLNKVFSADFHKNMTREINISGLYEPEKIALQLKIIEIEPKLLINYKISSLMENRDTQKGFVPYDRAHKLPEGNQPNLFLPWDYKMKVPNTFEESQTENLVEESRRCCNCKNCSGKGHTICTHCDRKGVAKCYTCLQSGKVFCGNCNGSGTERYKESFEKRDPCSCGNGFITTTDFGASMFNASHIGQAYVNPNRLKKCPRCSGRGYHIRTDKRNLSRPCAYCSTTGKVTCDECNGTLEITCPHCIGGKIICKPCTGKGMIEHHQIIIRKLQPVAKEDSFWPEEIPEGFKKPLESVQFKTLCERIAPSLLEVNPSKWFKQNVDVTFLNHIIFHITNESKPTQENQQLALQAFSASVTCFYKLNYEFEKTSFTSWWHPVTGEIISEDKPLAMILRGILEEADQLWKNKFYFEAGGKYGLAKKLAKKDNYCQGIFNKHLKKQSFLMKLWTNLASIFSFF